MESVELLLWRKERKISQKDLAQHLGVARVTVNRWEQGHSRIPVTVPGQLAKLVNANIVEKAGPEFVVPNTAHHWPGLHLYEKFSAGRYLRGDEHPGYLLGIGGKVPAAVMDSDEYHRALARKRALPHRDLDPNLYPGLLPGETAVQWHDRTGRD